MKIPLHTQQFHVLARILNHCHVTSIIFFHFKMLPITTQTSLITALCWQLVTLLAVTTTGTASESKNHFHERIMLFSTLTQNQGLNSPFLFHVSIQIEADTLYLVHINPGNRDQEFSTIIFPMSLLCGARAVNKMIQTATVSFVGTYVLACELCDFKLCKMKQKVSLVLLMVRIKYGYHSYLSHSLISIGSKIDANRISRLSDHVHSLFPNISPPCFASFSCLIKENTRKACQLAHLTRSAS